MCRRTYSLLSALLVSALLVSCNEDNAYRPEEEVNEGLNAVTQLKESIDIRLSEELAAKVGSQLSEGNLVTKSGDLNDLFETYGAVSVRKSFPDEGEYAERHKKWGLDRWFTLEIAPGTCCATKAVESLQCIEGVEIAESRPSVKLLETDDKYYGYQWHLYQENGIDINVEEVWNNYTSGSQQVIVSVVDSGIDIDHEDLNANAIPAGKGKSFNFCNDSYTIQPAAHGTHVAGIISAVRNNGKGVAGIVGGDARMGINGVKLLSCQVFGTDSNGESISRGFEEAIVYGADHGAVISQNSWGYEFDTNKDGAVTGTELDAAKNFTIPAKLKTAIEYFIENAGCDNDGNQLPDSPMKGGVVFFSAGNDNIEWGWPARYEKVIAVGSITSKGEKSPFSNYGDWVDICAPGSNIYSTIPGSSYDYMSGTSMSCPVVSGVAALVISYKGGIGFTNEDLVEALLQSATYDKISSNKIGPLVDALGAVSYGSESAPGDILAFSGEANSNTVTLEWIVPAKEDGNAAYAASIYYSKNRESLENLNLRSPGSDVKTAKAVTSNLNAGDKASCKIGGLQFEQRYYFTMAAFNPGPVYSSQAPIIEVVTGDNHAPVVSASIDISNLSLRSSDRIALNLTVSDPDGHAFTYEYIPASNAEVFIYNDNVCQISMNGAHAEAGKYTARLEARDEYGAASVFNLNYTILENEAPVLEGKLDNVLVYNNKQTTEIELTPYFSDPDGDTLKYSVSTENSKIASITTSGSKLLITTFKEGTTKVNVTASDPRGASVSDSFKLVVREENQFANIYPTQVSETLFIAGSAESQNTAIKIISLNSGNVIFEEALTTSAFEPAEIDFSKVASGRYSVEVSLKEGVFKNTIVKL